MTTTVTLCTLAVTALAGCTQPGQATPSAAAEAGSAAATESPVAATNSPAAATSSPPATTNNPAAATNNPVAGGTQKPGATAQQKRPQTAAAAQGKVTGLSVTLVNGRQDGDCPGRLTVRMNATMQVVGGPVNVTLVAHDSDGGATAPMTYPPITGSTTAGQALSIQISPDQPKRTVEFWVESTAPNRVTSGRATFTVNCLKVWA